MKAPTRVRDGAGVIVDYLIREKVPYAFGLCGHGNIGFIDALHARSGEIKTVHARKSRPSFERTQPRGSRMTASKRRSAWYPVWKSLDQRAG